MPVARPLARARQRARRIAASTACSIRRPAPHVKQGARALLADHGLRLRAADDSGTIRTRWRPILDDAEFVTAFEKYIVVVKRLSSEHCRITAMTLSVSTPGMETAHPHDTSKNVAVGRTENTNTYGKGKNALPIGTPAVRRDLDLEWKLIALEEPERAKLVQSDIAWLVAHR